MKKITIGTLPTGYPVEEVNPNDIGHVAHIAERLAKRARVEKKIYLWWFPFCDIMLGIWAGPDDAPGEARTRTMAAVDTYEAAYFARPEVREKQEAEARKDIEMRARLGAKLANRYLKIEAMTKKGATIEAVAEAVCDAARLCERMNNVSFGRYVQPAFDLARKAIGERWPGCVGEVPPKDVDRCCIWNALDLGERGVPHHAALDIWRNWCREMAEGPWKEGHALTFMWRNMAAGVVTPEDVHVSTKAEITITHIKALVNKGFVGEVTVKRLCPDGLRVIKVPAWYITAKGYHAATGEPAPLSVLENIARCDALREEN